jgi:hypothetical protein
LIVRSPRESHSLFDDGEGIPAASNEYLPGLCQFDTLLIPLENCKADAILQFYDLFAQRGLGDFQTLSCSCEVEFFSKCDRSDLESNPW